MNKKNIVGCFAGLAVGDALGVPVEFKKRSFMKENPISELTGWGTWDEPAGTWSDDSSLSFCTAESLIQGYDLHSIADSFLKWRHNAFWTAHNKVFDIGNTTSVALDNLMASGNPRISGLTQDSSNGNGSLMRIAPVALYSYGFDDKKLWQTISDVSSITHAHLKSVVSCFILSKLLIKILQGDTKELAWRYAKSELVIFLSSKPEYKTIAALGSFQRLLLEEIAEREEHSIQSSGYVVDTLEASFWSFLKSNNFEEAVLTSIHLGGDTDTIGSITGALAGLYYGIDSIPERWLTGIARSNDILKLAEKFYLCLDSKTRVVA